VVFADIASATSALRGMQGFPFYEKPIVSAGELGWGGEVHTGGQVVLRAADQVAAALCRDWATEPAKVAWPALVALLPYALLRVSTVLPCRPPPFLPAARKLCEDSFQRSAASKGR